MSAWQRGSSAAASLAPSSPSLSTSSSRITFAYLEPRADSGRAPSCMKVEPQSACEQARSSSGASSRPARVQSATVHLKSATEARPISSIVRSVSASASSIPGTRCVNKCATPASGCACEPSPPPSAPMCASVAG
eukprot:scaffold83710_cov32-Tisochrysis_lutea.AAC.1